MTTIRSLRIWHLFAQPVLLVLLAPALLAACNGPVRNSASAPVSKPSSTPTVHAEAIANVPHTSKARFLNPRLAFDSNGVLHLIYGMQSDTGSKLFHQQRAADGNWSAPEPLRDGVDGGTLIVRPSGEVCALWTGYVDVVNLQGNALLMRCQTGGTWSDAQEVGSFYALEPVFAPDGTPYVLAGPNTLSLNGTNVSGECSSTVGLLAIDQSSRFHAAWAPLSGGGCKPMGSAEYSTSTDNGKTWSKPESLDDKYPPVALLADKQGRVHVLLAGGAYRQWLPNKGWGTPVQTGLPFNFTRATLDMNDSIHLVAQDFLSSDKNLEHYYVHQEKDGTWSAPVILVKIDDLADPTIPITVDAQGQPHFAWIGKDGQLYEATLR